jgi:hypothetical protein
MTRFSGSPLISHAALPALASLQRIVGADTARRDHDIEPLFQLLERKALLLDFELSMHWPRVRALMKRWTRMDLSDASIVVMSELHPKSQVVTVDRSDFSLYRRNDRHVISFIAPSSR